MQIIPTPALTCVCTCTNVRLINVSNTLDNRNACENILRVKWKLNRIKKKTFNIDNCIRKQFLPVMLLLEAHAISFHKEEFYIWLTFGAIVHLILLPNMHHNIWEATLKYEYERLSANKIFEVTLSKLQIAYGLWYMLSTSLVLQTFRYFGGCCYFHLVGVNFLITAEYIFNKK